MKRFALILALLLFVSSPVWALNSYEASLTSTASTTGTTFKPTDGKFALSVSGTWVGSVQVQRKRNADSTWNSVGDPFTSNTEQTGEHAGGAQYDYRAYGTISSGTATVRMTQK